MTLLDTLLPVRDGLPCTCHTRNGCHVHGPQPREQATTCWVCRQSTWAIDGRCDQCRAKEQTNGGNITEQAHYVMPTRCHGCSMWTLGPAFCAECSAVTARAFQPAGHGKAAA